MEQDRTDNLMAEEFEETVSDEKKTKKKVKTGWIRLLAAFAAILILFSVGFIGVSAILDDTEFIEEQYTELGTAQDLGMSIPDLSKATQALFDYMKGRRDDIKVSALVNKVEMEDLFYHGKEIVHMEEVRSLWSGLTAFSIVGLGLAAGLLAIIVFFGKKNARLRATGTGLLLGTLIFAMLIGVIAIWAAGDFDSFWTVFHFIIFPSSFVTYLSGGMTVEAYNSLNWVFEPDYLMIRILDKLFLPLVMRAAIFFAVEIGVMLVFALILYFRGRALSQVGSDIVEVREVIPEERYVDVEDAPDLVLRHKFENASLEQKKKMMEELRKTPEQLEQEAKEAALKQAQAQEETIAEAFEPKEEKPDQTEDGTFLKPTSETGGTLRLEEIDEDEDEAWKASKPSEENGEKTDELF